MIHYNRRGTIFEGEWFSQASPREEEEEIVAPFAHWDDQALVLLQVISPSYRIFEQVTSGRHAALLRI